MVKRITALFLAILLAGCASSAPKQPEETAVPEETPAAEPSPSASASSSDEVPVTDSTDPVDYSNPDNWCMYGTGNEDAPADAFMIAATVYSSPVGNIELNPDTIRKEQAIDNRMAGMVTDSCKIYSPAYRQFTLLSYDDADYEKYSDYAYNDVRDAFRYYLDNVHEKGRPLLFFSYSQGAELQIELAKEFFAPDTEEAASLREDLVGFYNIGWGTEKSLFEEYPNLKPAEGADDPGVMISFDCETPEVDDSLILKKGTEYVSINPINWKTDSTRADASENLGAVLTNAKGEIKFEQAEFCGGYLDDTDRHALKVDDLDYSEYPNQIPILPEGSYHSYDITFFYRNLEENVNTRVNAWLSAH